MTGLGHSHTSTCSLGAPSTPTPTPRAGPAGSPDLDVGPLGIPSIPEMLRVLMGAVVLSEVRNSRSCLRCGGSCYGLAGQRPLCPLAGGLRHSPTADLPSGPAYLLTPLSGQSPAVSPAEFLRRGGSLGRTVWALFAFAPQPSHPRANKGYVDMKKGKPSGRLFLEQLFPPISQPSPPSGPLCLVFSSCDFLSQAPFHLPVLLGWSDPI